MLGVWEPPFKENTHMSLAILCDLFGMVFCDPFGFLSVTSNWSRIEWSPCFPWKPWRQARHTVVTFSPWSKQWKIDEHRKHYIHTTTKNPVWLKKQNLSMSIWHYHLQYYHHIISNFSLNIMSTFISLKISPIQTLEVIEAQTFALLCVWCYPSSPRPKAIQHLQPRI